MALHAKNLMTELVSTKPDATLLQCIFIIWILGSLAIKAIIQISLKANQICKCHFWLAPYNDINMYVYQVIMQVLYSSHSLYILVQRSRNIFNKRFKNHLENLQIAAAVTF